MRTGLRRRATLLCALGFLPAFGATAIAKDRVALIIGNSGYMNTSRLKNPVNDGKALSAAFSRLGYQVTSGLDLKKVEMDSQIRSFSKRLKGAEVAVFFYAGHGMQLDGKNYLVPIDFDPQVYTNLIDRLISFDSILNEMSRGPRTNIVFLDACRDNPLAKSLAQGMASGRSLSIDGKRGLRIVGSGLAEVEGKVGTLIAYATQPGNVASDGTGDHSPFTAGLLEHIETPGLEVREVLTRVRVSVVRETNEKQIPWDHSSLVDNFYFKKKKKRPPPPP